MSLRIFLLLVVVKLVWMKVAKTGGQAVDPEDESDPFLQLQQLEHSSSHLDLSSSPLDPSSTPLDPSSTTGPVMDSEEESDPSLQLQHLHLNHSFSKTGVSGPGVDQEDESDHSKELHHLNPTSPLDPSSSPLDSSIDSSDEKDGSLQHLDYSSSASSLNLIENDINILDEELNDFRANINDAMSEANSETTEVVGETFENNENENRLNELTKEQMNEEIEETSDKSKARKEEKPNIDKIGPACWSHFIMHHAAAETTAHNENLGKLTQHLGLEEKTRDVNEKPSSQTLSETMEMSKKRNIEIEFEQLNEEEDIMKMSVVDDKDDVMSRTIAEAIDSVATTMEEQMENKSVELIKELFEESKEDESQDSLVNFIIASEVHAAERNDRMEEADAKFIEELKEKIDFLEEGMNKYTSRLNFHLVDLERKKGIDEKTESEDWTINENSIENSLRVEAFSEVDLKPSDDLEKDDDSNGEDLENLENHVQVKEYSEDENIDDQKYSMHPNPIEGVDLWFPYHKDDLQHEEGSTEDTKIDNVNDDENIGENVHAEKLMEKTSDEVTQTHDDVLVQKEAKIKPNIKLLLKRTGFWRDTYEEGTSHKREVTVSWTMMLAGVPLMVLLLVLVVLMGIIFLNKTHKKPGIFMKSLNLWGNDYDRMQISAIKNPKYNKLK